MALLVGVIFLLSRCMNEAPLGDPAIVNNEGQAFAGSASCAGCHKDLYEDHLHTAHFLTSGLPSDEYIKGSFEPGSDTYSFNRSVSVVMEKRRDGYYQVEYADGAEKTARRMDIVVGSGTMGQSFLNWRKDHLFQLPITYFTAADEWSNSPGFPNRVVFNRVITSRCLECHSTFVRKTSEGENDPESFDRNKVIYGVDCEKCHGPGAQHVAFQSANPGDTISRFILNPADFSRQQKLDLCALCHGGRLQKTTPSFSFTAGDMLQDHFIIDSANPDPSQIDVHGNQYGLLRASQCFKRSETMTCGSCHDTHRNEKSQPALFSQRCMSCHTPGGDHFCPLGKTVGSSIVRNCIDCHMPVQSSRAIAVFLPGQNSPTAARIRSHLISVYPDLSKKLLVSMKDSIH